MPAVASNKLVIESRQLIVYSLGDASRLYTVRNPRFAAFRTQPLASLSAAVIGFRATQPLEEILAAEILAVRTGCRDF